MKLQPAGKSVEISLLQRQYTRAGEIDLIADSLKHPLAVAFNKSNSSNYFAAVEAAKYAHKYTEVVQGKAVMHMAVFAADRVQLLQALHLLRYIKNLKSTRIFTDGQLQFSSHRIENVINCYQTSLGCHDRRAHCYKIVDESNKKYLIPCAQVAVYGGSAAVREGFFGASIVDKLQAIGMQRGCTWCPNFKPSDFRKL